MVVVPRSSISRPLSSRRSASLKASRSAESWIGVNSRLIDGFTRTRFVVEGMESLRYGGHYLVLANHQSWVDIPVLQKVFNRRIPLLRFFLKSQLFWVPLLGYAALTVFAIAAARTKVRGEVAATVSGGH